MDIFWNNTLTVVLLASIVQLRYLQMFMSLMHIILLPVFNLGTAARAR